MQSSPVESQPDFNAPHNAAELALKFKNDHGRPLRMLHIGNIANNAYNNAKVLNRIGFDCDVLCYDYYHVMGCPEWEDADFDGDPGDSFRPNWNAVDLNGFRRPKWFVQGPLHLALEYLLSRRKGSRERAAALWHVLARVSQYPEEKPAAADAGVWGRIVQAARRTYFLYRKLLIPRFIKRYPVLAACWRAAMSLRHRLKYIATRDRSIYGRAWCHLKAKGGGGAFGTAFAALAMPLLTLAMCAARAGYAVLVSSVRDRRDLPVTGSADADTASRSNSWVAAFKGRFPERSDQLSSPELQQYLSIVPSWREVLEQYDLVCGYSTDGVWPLLAGYRPYIAYEHGTIRDIPFEATTTGRLCALTYAEANAVYMTNADSIERARALGAKRLVYGLHGFDPERLNARVSAARSLGGHRRFGIGKDVKVFLAPARHHWRHGFASWRKGNDLVIRAAGKLAATATSPFKLVFVEWGEEVELSKALIAELGVGEHVEWISPMPKSELLQAYASVDCVIDQFVLPCIGSVTFEAIAVGKAPVITKLDDAAMCEHYGRTIPLFNCADVEEIYAAMVTILSDASEATRRAAASHDWFQERHSQQRLLETLAEAIHVCLPARQTSLHHAQAF